MQHCWSSIRTTWRMIRCFSSCWQAFNTVSFIHGTALANPKQSSSAMSPSSLCRLSVESRPMQGQHQAMEQSIRRRGRHHSADCLCVSDFSPWTLFTWLFHECYWFSDFVVLCFLALLPGATLMQNDLLPCRRAFHVIICLLIRICWYVIYSERLEQ
jgi:hypothetical protein